MPALGGVQLPIRCHSTPYKDLIPSVDSVKLCSFIPSPAQLEPVAYTVPPQSPNPVSMTGAAAAPQPCPPLCDKAAGGVRGSLSLFSCQRFPHWTLIGRHFGPTDLSWAPMLVRPLTSSSWISQSWLDSPGWTVWSPPVNVVIFCTMLCCFNHKQRHVSRLLFSVFCP